MRGDEASNGADLGGNLLGEFDPEGQTPNPGFGLGAGAWG